MNVSCYVSQELWNKILSGSSRHSLSVFISAESDVHV